MHFVDDEGLKEAYNDANKHSWTKDELDAYDYAAMREQDERGKMTKKIKDVAIRLIRMGIAVEQVAEATGLTTEEVQAIAKEINP